MILFFILFMADYLLTYAGLQAGYIMEANPFMRSFMSLELLPGVILRILIALSLCTLFYYIKKNDIKTYRKLLRFITAILVFVMALHTGWIVQVNRL